MCYAKVCLYYKIHLKYSLTKQPYYFLCFNRKNDYVMTLNSAYRTLNQQLALYKWQPNCGMLKD